MIEASLVDSDASDDKPNNDRSTGGATATIGAISADPSHHPIIQVDDLRKTYRGGWLGRRGNVEALRGVSLAAGTGEVFGLLGPNGAGKTTLIKTLLGIIAPTGGHATLFGKPIGSQASRQRVGYLPESLRIDRHHTARTALHYYGRLSRMDSVAIRRRSDELLELVGLRERDRESVRRFSKGMYQRLGLAQALMHDPDLLILDEPTDGLDPVGRNDVRKVIERLSASGKTIFLNSHILQEVELVCTQVAIMAKGTIRAMGPVDSIPAQLGTHDATQLATLVSVIVPDHFDTAQWQAIERDHAISREPIAGQADAFRLETSLPDQAALDRFIDRLRAETLSIRSLAVRRPTLEDMFIELVNDSAAVEE